MLFNPSCRFRFPFVIVGCLRIFLDISRNVGRLVTKAFTLAGRKKHFALVFKIKFWWALTSECHGRVLPSMLKRCCITSFWLASFPTRDSDSYCHPLRFGRKVFFPIANFQIFSLSLVLSNFIVMSYNFIHISYAQDLLSFLNVSIYHFHQI